MSSLRALRAVLGKHPLLSNMTLYTLLYGAGDLTRQSIQRLMREKSSESGYCRENFNVDRGQISKIFMNENDNINAESVLLEKSQNVYTLQKEKQTSVGIYDINSVSSMAAVGGLCIGPINYAWFKILDSFIPGKTAKCIIKKLLLDQLFVAPITVAVFYIAIGVIQKSDIIQILREKYLKTYLTGCVFWPCAQAINFAYFPPHLRAGYVACVAYFWTTVLSYIKSQSYVKEIEID